MGAGVTAIGFGIAWLDRRLEARTSLVVAGSETLRPWFEACADAFERAQPSVNVIVRGGGSASGVGALLAGQTDLALVSRPLTDTERQQAVAQGGALIAWSLGEGAVAVIVHPSVTLEQLDMAGLARLLEGSVADWSALGSKPMPVHVIHRHGDSGTGRAIEDVVLDGRTLPSTIEQRARPDEVAASVAATPGAIGYVDVPVALKHAAAVRLMPLSRGEGHVAQLPTSQPLGTYPLSRPLLLVAREPVDQPVAALAGFCRGAPGQELLDRSGLVAADKASKG